MKHSEIALGIAAIVTIAILFVTFFIGWNGFLQPRNPSASPPPDDATLWEKAYWDSYHGSIPQCGWFAESDGPVVLYPGTGSTLANITFRYVLIPGERPHEFSKVSYILSTRFLMKTVRYGDPAVTMTTGALNRTTGSPAGDLRNLVIEDDELVTVELDPRAMGFDGSSLGPNQRFVISIVPEDDCIRHVQLWGTTPVILIPGTRVEISGQR